MPTICIDCRYIGNGPSGIGEVVQALVDHAPRLSPELSYLLLRNPEQREPLSTQPNVQEVIVASAANSPFSMWGLPWLTDLSQVDLFHAPSNILPARLPMKTVTTVHDIMWLTHPHWCNASTYGRLEQMFYGNGIRRALNKSDHITTVSAATRQAILDRWPDLAERVTVTRSGVSTRFRPVTSDPDMLARLGIERDQRFVLTVGQYAPYKNHEGALRAFAEAFRSDPSVRFVAVQRRGSGQSKLSALASSLGIAGQVQFLGPVSSQELIQLYSASAVLLHPSLCEGFGNPIAEAMACGCPVITSDTSAMPEVTCHAAQLVNPLDTAAIAASLRAVLSDQQLAENMRAAGIARAAELDWSDFAAANLAVYREVLGLT